ncbi:TPA: hypothetical protein ACIUUB_004506, partial [Shigella flexneri]
MNKPQLAESQKTALLTEAESVIRQPGRAVRLNRETDESGEARGAGLRFSGVSPVCGLCDVIMNGAVVSRFQ